MNKEQLDNLRSAHAVFREWCVATSAKLQAIQDGETPMSPREVCSWLTAECKAAHYNRAAVSYRNIDGEYHVV